MRRSVRREAGHGGEAVWDRPGQRRVRRGERLTVWSFFFFSMTCGQVRAGLGRLIENNLIEVTQSRFIVPHASLQSLMLELDSKRFCFKIMSRCKDHYNFTCEKVEVFIVCNFLDKRLFLNKRTITFSHLITRQV